MRKLTILFISLALMFIWGSLVGADSTEKIRKDFHPKPQNWSPKDYINALKRSKKRYPFVDNVLKEDLPVRILRLRKLGLGIKDIKHSFMVLQSPYVNTFKDKYGPVKFMHGKHASVLKGNCALCHHFRPLNSSQETVPCRSCHKYPFDPDHPERLGLKAAYHQKCIGCHKEMKKGPTDCTSCHLRNVPDHKKLVKLPKDPTPYQVTQECLRCHKDAAENMLTSAHWLWRGPSTYTINHRKCIKHGKGTDVLNND